MANKYILIQWEDTLKANTTYNFNFGNSIADNNEGNVLPYYNFVFSTGSTIDSLFISGNVDDVLRPRKRTVKRPIRTTRISHLWWVFIKQMQKIIKKSLIIFRE